MSPARQRRRSVARAARAVAVAASERAGVRNGGAAGAADEGGHVETEAGRGCRVTGVAGAWSPRGGRALALVGTRRAGTARHSAEAGRAREVGWAGQAAGAAAGRAGFGREPRKEAAARERRNHFSQFPF